MMPIAPQLEVALGLKLDSAFATALRRLTDTPYLAEAASKIESRSTEPEDCADFMTSEKSAVPLDRTGWTVFVFIGSAEPVFSTFTNQHPTNPYDLSFKKRIWRSSLAKLP
jgi:hypothetical protein